jgi:hypothetical protein
VWRVVPSNLALGRVHLPLNWIVIAALLVILLTKPFEFARTPEGGPHANVIETSNMLHAAGARSASEILSSNPYHQDVASPTRDRFAMLYLAETPPTVDELRRVSLNTGLRFLIYDATSGVDYHPQYRALLAPEARPRGYTPIWIGENNRFVAYRFEPDVPLPQTTVSATLAGGITLVGYDVSVVRLTGSGFGVGVYLYWRATRPLTESLKVFVHVLDAQGQLAAQHDGLPAQWTYPTPAWQPGEVVIDFHQAKLDAGASRGEYVLQVGLYDEETGARVKRVDTSGGDAIVLTKITLPK